MALVENFSLVVLFVASMTSQIRATSDASVISLDVYHNNQVGGLSGMLAINCTLDASLTNLDTVASLALFGSKPYGGEGEFDQLAVVDIWSKSPKLANELDAADVSLIGEIGRDLLSPSTLVLSWKSSTSLYRQSYKCVANGLNTQGLASSVSTSARFQTITGGCCGNMDSMSSELQGILNIVGDTANTSEQLTQEVKTLNKKLEDLGANVAAERVDSLNQKLDSLEAKVDTIVLSSRVHAILIAIDRTKFDVSGLNKDRFYLVSKHEAPFNIEVANNACLLQGGYLLELDDDEETQLVSKFAMQVGGSDHFALGGNDREEEGKFVYFNSKKPVPDHLTWKSNEPNNSGNKEDCMEIWVSQNGLNDKACDFTSKYVCEVPVGL